MEVNALWGASLQSCGVHTNSPMKQLLPLAAALPLVALSFCALAAHAQQPPTVGAERARELVRLVRQDCGSCHGLTLKGGLGPPLLPETLRDKPEDSLRSTVLQGRSGTPMPPWQAFVSEAEADWIVKHLMAGFPQEEAAGR